MLDLPSLPSGWEVTALQVRTINTWQHWSLSVPDRLVFLTTSLSPGRLTSPVDAPFIMTKEKPIAASSFLLHLLSSAPMRSRIFQSDRNQSVRDHWDNPRHSWGDPVAILTQAQTRERVSRIRRRHLNIVEKHRWHHFDCWWFRGSAGEVKSVFDRRQWFVSSAFLDNREGQVG